MSRHVLLVFHEPSLGGATAAVLRVLPRLREDGWTFAAWAPPGPAAEALRSEGVTVAGEPRPVRFSLAALREPPGAPARIVGTPGYLRRFARHVAEVAPDVVHANTLLTLPEALAARRAGAAVLVHVHEMLPPDLRGKAAARLARHAADHVVTVSRAAALALRAQGVRAELVTAGVALPPPRAAPRAGPLVVGTIATVSARKGSDIFLAAAQALGAQHSELGLRMVGPLAPGPERPWAQALMSRARGIGITVGPTTRPMEELAAWDVFVLPTRRDPFPLVVLEAMATGLPVVATSVDGVPEQVGQAGVLVPPDDAGAVAREVDALLADRARRELLGSAARDRVERLFNPDRHASELASAYARTREVQHLATRARPPRPRLS
ncbi:MAG: glycosyltransferase family 4 protein [Solirubrobacteraceae bacterium]